MNFEKKEFQYQREDSILLTHFGSFFRVSQFSTMSRSKLCLKKFFTTNVKLFVEAFREEIKPVVNEKLHFENRAKSKLLAYFFSVGYQKPNNGTKVMIFQI